MVCVKMKTDDRVIRVAGTSVEDETPYLVIKNANGNVVGRFDSNSVESWWIDGEIRES
jgi:hypothetical protein